MQDAIHAIVALITMALLSNISLSTILYGMLLAWLVEAQTETVYMYLTQVQTIFTACECPVGDPLGLSVSVACALP